MGNTATMGNIPNDPTKCSKEQLQLLINSVIIYDPWSQDEEKSDEEVYHTTLILMKQKGFRPITPDEYIEELKRRREVDPENLGNIKVWVPYVDHSIRVFTDDPDFDASVDEKTCYDYKVNNERESKQYQRQKDWEKNHPGEHEVRSFYTATTLTMESCNVDNDDSSIINKLSISLPTTVEDAAFIMEQSGYCYSNDNAANCIQITGSSQASTEEWPHYNSIVKKQQEEYHSHKKHSSYK